MEKIFAYWFSICLFDSMKSDLGQNLYLLYKALKYQIEKGPIDAINGNARYSLNEQKLLREPIDAATLVRNKLESYEMRIKNFALKLFSLIFSRTLNN